MYGLHRIIQIDGFIPGIRTVIELDGHSIINGTNGAGKSSTLKLLSFFYGGDPSQLDSHAAGRDPFTQFYLPRQTSLLVFEYARESGLCCAVAYRHKSGTKHVYRFLEGGFSEERFSRKGSTGKTVYCKGHELKMHWRELDLSCSQQIEIVTNYRAIIQNDSALINRLSDSKTLRRLAGSYCLGSRKTHMRYIDRICAAIISRSGNMERMKDMLADIMAEDGVIFPQTPIHPADESLAKEISSLKAFEREVPRMKSVLSRHYGRLDIEARLSAYGGQVKQANLDLAADDQRTNDRLSKVSERLADLQLGWDSEYGVINKALIDAENKVESCEGKIDRLDRQYDDYENADMEKKVFEFNNLGRFMDDAEQTKQRYKLLSEEVKEEDSAQSHKLNAEYQRFERTRSEIQLQLDAAKEKAGTKSLEHTSSREALLKREATEVEVARSNASPDKELLIEAKARAQATADNGGPTKEEQLSLAIILERIDTIEIEEAEALKVSQEKITEHEKALNRRSVAQEEFESKTKNYHAKQARRDELHKIAFAEDGTWLKRLREKDASWENRLGKLINPDLLHRKDLYAEYAEGELDTIFGWSINLDAIATPQHAETEAQLRSEFSVQEDAVRCAKEDVDQQEIDCKKANMKFKEAELLANEARLSLDKKGEQKELARKSYRAKEKDINNAIFERRTTAKKEVINLEEKVLSFDKELSNRILDIKERHREAMDELLGAFSLESSRIVKKIERLSSDLSGNIDNFNDRKKQIKKDFEQACSDKGIDSKTIEGANKSADNAQKKVQSIRDSASLVNAYIEWLGAEWEKRDSLISKLGDLKALMEQAGNKKKDQERLYIGRKEELNDEKSKELSYLTMLNEKKEQLNIIRPRFLFYMDNSEAIAPSMPFELLIQEVQSLLDSNEKMKNQLIEDVQWIDSKIMGFDETQVGQAWLRAKDNLRQKLNYDDPYDRNFLINLPQALEVFLDEEIKNIQAARIESLRGVGKGLTDFFEHLDAIHKRIREQSRKITSVMAESMKIDALSSMGISLTSKIDSLDYWRSLQDFSKSWQQWRESGEYGLPEQELLDGMSALIGTLKGIKSGNHLRNYFDLHIRMVENGNERIIKNDYQLENSTSDGLKYLALCVIFVAISRLLCPDKNVLLHWPIDELGILHGDNIARLFNMLNDGGIVMVGGFPSEDPVMLRHFKHRQVIDFKTGVRIMDIPKSTLRERALARRNLELIK